MLYVYPGSCFDIDPRGDWIDVVLCDPPYSEHVHKNATSCGTKALGGGGPAVRKRDLEFDCLSPRLRAYVAQCAGLAKRWSVVYTDVEGAHLWREWCPKAGAEYIRTLPWVRWSQPQLSGDRPPTGFEELCVFWGQQKGPKSWNGRGNLVALEHKALRGKEKHKAEKPLDQALDLVCYFSNPGELVYDPTAGVGTLGVACALLGRHYIGAELRPDWAAKAQARIDWVSRGKLIWERDVERADRWLQSMQESQTIVDKPPTKEQEVKQWKRAGRRLADAARCYQNLRRAA